MRLRNLIPYASADTGGGSGSGQSAPPPTPPAPADPLAGLQRLLERQSGDAGRVAELLYRDNYELRERNRQLAGSVPPQGAVVLTPEQAVAWTAYQALGAPEALQTAMQERTQAQTRLTALEREQAIAAAAATHGYQAQALTKLIQADSLSLSIREETRDGQIVRTALVTPPNGQPVPLVDYATANWAAFLPALVAAPGGQTPPRVPPQGPAGTGGGGDRVAQFVQQTNAARDAVPNPLVRKG